MLRLELIPLLLFMYISMISCGQKQAAHIASLDSLCNTEWKYKEWDVFGDFDAYPSGDGKYLVIEKWGNKKVPIYDAHTHNLLTEIATSFSSECCIISFLSESNDTIFILDTLDIRCYSVPSGDYLMSIPYDKALLTPAIVDNICKMPTEIQQEWLVSLGFQPDEVNLWAYNKKRKLALIQKDLIIDEEECRYVLDVFDCSTKRTIYTADDNRGTFNNQKSVKCACEASFSHSGEQLAVSYYSGESIVINLVNFTKRKFLCGNPSCAHQSNVLFYSQDDRLLHTSWYENGLIIIDNESLVKIDSIVPPNQGEISDAYLFGDTCWIQAGDYLYFYYKTR